MTDQGWQAIEMRIRFEGESHRFYARACPKHHDALLEAVEKFEKKHGSPITKKLVAGKDYDDRCDIENPEC